MRKTRPSLAFGLVARGGTDKRVMTAYVPSAPGAKDAFWRVWCPWGPPVLRLDGPPDVVELWNARTQAIARFPVLAKGSDLLGNPSALLPGDSGQFLSLQEAGGPVHLTLSQWNPGSAN